MAGLFDEADHGERRADAIVIFGVTGDLAAKKILPALYGLARRGRLTVPVIGVARSAWSTADLIGAADRAVGPRGERGRAAFDHLTERLRMVTGDYADPATYRVLGAALSGADAPVFYLATPPAAFEHIAAGLRASGLAQRGRLVVEKPFGHDAASAVALESRLRDTVSAERIFHVDHYLEKEPVEGLRVLRFDNPLLERVWDRQHIAAVEITLAEQVGTEQRPGFYDGVGAIRDVVQNHVLQIVALLAMERPVDDSATGLHDAQAAVLRQIRTLATGDIVRGQYVGYREQAGVATDSRTETFAAVEFVIDNPRWSGVPFRVRAGKRLAATATEVVIEFRRLDHLVADPSAAPDVVRFRLGHNDGVTISLRAKAPGRGAGTRSVDLSVDFDAALGQRQEAYERLLEDVLEGDHRRFARWDAIEQQWRIVADVLDLLDRPVTYRSGSWGPSTAAGLGAHRWHPLSADGRSNTHGPGRRLDVLDPDEVAV